MPPQPAGALSPLGLPLKPVSVLLPFFKACYAV
jgi:hypothetical protein